MGSHQSSERATDEKACISHPLFVAGQSDYAEKFRYATILRGLYARVEILLPLNWIGAACTAVIVFYLSFFLFFFFLESRMSENCRLQYSEVTEMIITMVLSWSMSFTYNVQTTTIDFERIEIFQYCVRQREAYT